MHIFFIVLYIVARSDPATESRLAAPWFCGCHI